MLGWFGVFQWTFEFFPHLQKTHDPLLVNLGHGIFKLIFLKDAKQTGK